MSENNKKNLVDEELENVTGGRGHGVNSSAYGREMKRQKKVEQLAKEAVGRMNPNDPTSWFQTVSDVFDENARNQ
ncbi:MAG: hypothetical protein IJ683_01590 [Butyrivibrio sp.]|nr:hypothetical protein [Butyrivibrio sp.]MBR1640998.1 hypothetical protein [Butyrivibrio sp.]